MNKYSRHMLITGKSGTGKTHYAIEMALSAKRPIVIIRSIVPTREIGFLPGDLDDKLAPYFELYEPIFKKLVKNGNLKNLVTSNKVKFVSTSFLRGATFEDCEVILDESQNCGLHELETVLTRLGKTSRLIVTGDMAQTDLRADETGFSQFCEILAEIPDVEIKELHENFRSKLLTAYFKAKSKYVKD